MPHPKWFAILWAKKCHALASRCSCLSLDPHPTSHPFCVSSIYSFGYWFRYVFVCVCWRAFGICAFLRAPYSHMKSWMSNSQNNNYLICDMFAFACVDGCVYADMATSQNAWHRHGQRSREHMGFIIPRDPSLNSQCSSVRTLWARPVIELWKSVIQFWAYHSGGVLNKDWSCLHHCYAMSNPMMFDYYFCYCQDLNSCFLVLIIWTVKIWMNVEPL